MTIEEIQQPARYSPVRYRVYQDKAPCDCCCEGATWGVIDTVEDILIGGVSYHREEDAEWLTDLANRVVADEHSRIRRELLLAIEGPCAWADNAIIKSALLRELDRICPAQDSGKSK